MDKELEALRLQIRDRDLEIIDLTFKLKTANETIQKMRSCENCKHSEYDGQDYSCTLDGKCSKPSLAGWELKQ